MDDDIVAGLRALGASPADIERAQQLAAAAQPADDFHVFHDNQVAWGLFLRVQTQWDCVALSTMQSARLIRTGLKYPSVESHLRMARVRRSEIPALWDDLQLIEHAVLAADRVMEERKRN